LVFTGSSLEGDDCVGAEPRFSEALKKMGKNVQAISVEKFGDGRVVEKQ
jgi:cyanate lyase